MAFYKHLREGWNTPNQELWRERLLQWRDEPVTVKVERPTRLDRARSLGYKAKQGILVVRHRVSRGGHTRHKIKGGRRSKRFGTRLDLRKNYQALAEGRVQRDFPNLTVLSSYMVARDGKHFWYEIILVDSHHPVIAADANLKWLLQKKRQSRVFQGQTSAGKKGRGLRA